MENEIDRERERERKIQIEKERESEMGRGRGECGNCNDFEDDYHGAWLQCLQQ